MTVVDASGRPLQESGPCGICNTPTTHIYAVPGMPTSIWYCERCLRNDEMWSYDLAVTHAQVIRMVGESFEGRPSFEKYLPAALKRAGKTIDEFRADVQKGPASEAELEEKLMNGDFT